MTTPTKPKRKRSSTRKPAAKKTYSVKPGCTDPSFFAQALTVQGRFTLSWMLLCAAVRILIRGRALV